MSTTTHYPVDNANHKHNLNQRYPAAELPRPLLSFCGDLQVTTSFILFAVNAMMHVNVAVALDRMHCFAPICRR